MIKKVLVFSGSPRIKVEIQTFYVTSLCLEQKKQVMKQRKFS